MPDYGFSVNLSGDVLQKMDKIEKALSHLANTTDDKVDKITKKLGEMNDGLKRVGETIAAVFAVDRVIEFGKEILHTTAEFEGFQNVIKYSSLNAYDAGQNLEYITQAATRLHLPLREAVQGFSEMQAGLIGTGIEGGRLRNLFEGISTASTVLHLSAYNLQRTLYDFKEIGEIGLNQRVMRSLSTALPGINAIIRETFGKSFKQLEEEHFSGGEFLAGLGKGLQKHFAPGLANAGNSLIAQLNDMSTAWEKFKLAMGENLRPVFIDILQTMRQIFNSAPVQFFIAHIADLVRILERILPIWIIYKTTMMTIAGVTRLAAGAQMLWATIMGETTVAINGATVAVEGFEGALMATGVGVFAIALGAIIEGFISMNNKIDESIEKIGHLKEAFNTSETLEDSFKRIEYTLNHQGPGENKTTAGERYSDMSSLAQRYSDEINKNKVSLGLLQQELHPDNWLKQLQGESPVEFAGRQEQFWNQQNKLKESINKLQGTINTETGHLATLNKDMAAQKAAGVVIPKPGAFPDNGGGMKNNALHTSDLAGAKGGLGEAKTITIHFHDALQKVSVSDGRGVVAAGQSAIEVIIKTLNNLAYGQSRTM